MRSMDNPDEEGGKDISRQNDIGKGPMAYAKIS